MATHVVGGHLEMVALDNTPGRYRIRLVVYQDASNPTNEEEGLGVYVYFFRNTTTN